ncbi:ABC transporter permease [Longirhabdus pacifica]|uniref:ABC transporter permease n=1 Tax=Longirhabdus pacifica TaxID=2305227 RepID=UPI001008B242|nr:ABC transporter permease [Longirhabdus pacifica]
MTLLRFTLNNVRRSKKRYLAFFLSSTFVIAVFYVYLLFMLHPSDVINNVVKIIQVLMIAAEFLIFMFAFMFIWYTMNTFIKSRSVEFGMFMMLGMTKMQLNRFIFIETMMIGCLSIVTGIVSGTIFSKLFLMIMSQILNGDQSFSFYMPYTSIVITCVVFIVLFVFISLITSFTNRNKQIIDLLQAHKKPRRFPTFSIWLMLLSAACFIGVYKLAFTSNFVEIVLYSIPILILPMIGTYFLYTQFCMLTIYLLKRRKSFMYRKISLLTISDLAYKLKDNARVLLMLTMVNLFSLIMLCVNFGHLWTTENYVKLLTPVAIQISNEVLNHADDLDQASWTKVINIVGETLKDEQVEFIKEHVNLLHVIYEGYDANYNKIVLPDNFQTIRVMSHSDFNTLAEILDKDEITMSEGEYVQFLPPPYTEDVVSSKLMEGVYFEHANMLVGQQTFSLTRKGVTEDIVLNEFPIANVLEVIKLEIDVFETIIVHDDTYDQLQQAGASTQWVSIFHIDNWIGHLNTILYIQEQFKAVEEIEVTTTAEEYYVNKQLNGTGTFITLFISLLFFIACGSILYFKIYNELERDTTHYRKLFRIGVTLQEMKNVFSIQMFILCFIPFLMATILTFFALNLYQTVYYDLLCVSSVSVLGVFFLLHVVLYFILRYKCFTVLRRVI